MRVLSGTSRSPIRVGAIVLAGAALLAGCAQAAPTGSLAPEPVTASAGAVGPTVSLAPQLSASAPEPIPTASVVPTATLPTATSVPTPSAVPTPTAVPTSSAVPTRRAPSPTARATTKPSTRATTPPGGANPLAKLLDVPKGFTLPPGAKIQRAVTTGASSAVALSAPPAPVAVAYLRAELKRLGYTQLLVKKSGVITAYAYRSGNSVISLSGGQANGVSITAIVFAKVAATPKPSS